MRINLFDDHHRKAFYPLSLTRPIGDLRHGIFTLSESWSQLLGHQVKPFGIHELSDSFPLELEEDNFFINARLFPTAACRPFAALRAGHRQDADLLEVNTCIRLQGETLLLRADRSTAEAWLADPNTANIRDVKLPEQELQDCVLLRHLTDLFTLNDRAINADYRQVTHGRVSAKLDPTVTVLGDPGLVFIEEGAQVEACYLNTRQGPIYIGSGSMVMEGAVLHGPIALCEQVTVRAGTRIYGATTVGPHCKVGGEISNSLFQDYSNKAHDGFLGNSVIGSWCNLGADTNTSNLKNNYSSVKLYAADSDSLQDSGLTFCGLLMGDHSKCGINTMFNTGTVVGVSANIFGGGFPPKHIPSFFWGGSESQGNYRLNEALETARKVMARRGMQLSSSEEKLLSRIHESALVAPE